LQNGVENKRLEIINELANRGVGTSIYYPRPVPELTYYAQKYNIPSGSFPEAAKIAYHSIALPVGPHLNEGDAEYIVKSVKDVLSKIV
jgi:dTDP-4-amino-4,6-dideoxygalactose transaminase